MADQAKLQDYLKRAVADARDLQRRLREAQDRNHEPIAVVAMSCRYPGGVDTPEQLWELLDNGRETLSGFPTDRGWPLDTLFDPDPDHPGTTYVDKGHFLTGAAGFDPGFFDISPREAVAMDPQQRLLLATCWEAVERAGLDPHTLKGSRTGVFAGVYDQNYVSLAGRNPDGGEGHFVSGAATSVVSGRVAYTLGLEGPAVSIDTACSSSLVAVHLATQSLRTGECTMALAGGVTVMATPGSFIGFGKQRGLSKDGRCHAFGAGADGMGMAEGVGVLLLERLADAQRLGHPVLAVISGSAVNSDGMSNGLAAPNGPSQQRVIRAALANARIGAADVDAVEAHGTGTRLGDPIEADALLATYGQSRSGGRPLLLGSLKSNIGHTQAAAGVGGVIKTVLALKHGVLPRTLHADEPTGEVDWTTGEVELLGEATAWPPGERVRRAGVSSFGLSGTNAHVIVEEAPVPANPPAVSAAGPSPWVFSARTPEALTALATSLRERTAGLAAADVAWSLATGRSGFEQRAVVLDDHLATLEAFDTAPAEIVSGAVVAAGRTVFVFPGQGSQWVGMATGLLGEPVFAAALDRCAAALAPHVDWALRDVLTDEAALQRVDVVQPALWAVMVSLAELWRSLGVEPDAVAGHSQGEIAAAVVAGALSIEDGARVVALRSKAILALSGLGGMVSVALPESEVRALIAPHDDDLAVAAVNGPAVTVVSGTPDALGALLATCETTGVRARRIDVDYASHSAQVESIRDRILADLAPISPRPATVPMFSTVLGDWLGTTPPDAAYWVRNLRHPVLLAPAVSALAAQGFGRFLEVSAHPVLTVGIEQTLEQGSAPAVVTATLRREAGDRRQLLRAAAEFWVRGGKVDWPVVLTGGNRVDLPTYPFRDERYWLADGVTTTGPDPVDSAFWELVDRGDAAAFGPDTEGVGALLPALAKWRDQHRAGSAAEAWRYRITWEPITPPAGTGLDGSWLVVVPAGHEDDPWVRALTPPGATTVAVTRTSLPGALGEVEPDGVLSLLAVADEPDPDHPALPSATALTVALIQALGERAWTAPLWCATTGAVAIDATDPLTAPAAALIWGTGYAAALEAPNRWGGLIDLPATIDPATLARFFAVLTLANEDQVAIRPSGVHARRLATAPRPRKAARHWKPTGTVLVTGGTGAIGPQLVRWLAAAGAPRIVLTSRRGPDVPGAAELTAELAPQGTSLSVVTCDVTDRTALAALLADLDAAGTPVTAVIHAAADIGLASLAETTIGDYARIVDAKAAGAANLDALLDHELDAFVLFSSIAGVWGSGDHGAYGAGNAYLDALATARRQRGLTATSVDWGVWRAQNEWAPRYDVAAGSFDSITKQGLRLLDPGIALTALRQILDDDDSVVIVADVDWPRFAPVFTSARPSPLIAALPAAATALETVAPTAGDSATAGIRARLAGQTGAEQHRILLDLIRNAVAAVLRHKDAAAIPADKAFQELGFDSLTAVELRTRLTTATGLRLPATLVFDHPSAGRLAGYLRDQLTGSLPVTTAEVTRAGADDDPIAVVALGCRLPGGIDTPERFWALLDAGGDAVSGFPTDRGWPLSELFDDDPDMPGTTYCREGGFLHDAGNFDADFFGISPREASGTDPQQRLLLEVAWETLERAGIDPESLQGSRTGVYVGVNYSDYSAAGARTAENEAMVTGSGASLVSGRIAYTLGLEGPAVTVDTACSSSLVALHMARQALRSGDCTLALVGGVAVMSNPGPFIGFSRQRGLAADGRCKAFADAADGMGMAEGIGAILVERLSDARANGHPVLAVLRGSAINQDGASNGLAAPNGPAQQRVIRAALADAGLAGADVDLVEAHGTGTTLGDPIEAQAILATYGQDRDATRPLRLGSVKSNVGHTQAAAGVTGVIKTVLALGHGRIPATLHVDRPSRHVDWSAGAVELTVDAMTWPDTGRPRRAGVSSFGLSGTNAHVILEQAPDAATPEANRPGPAPWLLSAKSPAALTAQAERLAQVTGEPGDVAVALSRRAALSHRAVSFDAERGTATLPAIHGVADPEGRTVFVFPGQGAQWTGMAVELADGEPVFAAALDRCAAALAPYVDWSLTDVLTDEAALRRVDVVQPALWAVMVSLAELWRSIGVEPDAVVGHSQGEIAAAVVAGALSLDDGARVVTRRSQAIGALAGRGGMLSVAIDAATAEQDVRQWPGLSVAVVNGPATVVLAGEPAALEAARAHYEQQGVWNAVVPVDYASHTAQVDTIRAEITAGLRGISPAAPTVPMYSTVDGRWLDGTPLDEDYWFRNLRQPVRFADAVAALTTDGFTRFVETSPHPVLAIGVEQSAEAAGASPAVFATLRRDDGGREQFLRNAAKLWVHGVTVDWPTVLGEAPRVDLPTYAFQHERYWVRTDGPVTADVAAAGLTSAGHPLLGAAVELAETGEILLSGRLSVRTQPWLADHAVGGTILLPGTGLLELAVRAADEAGCDLIDELTLQAPLTLGADTAVVVQVRVGAPADDDRRPLGIYSRAEGATAWTRHADGLLAQAGPSEPAPAATTWPPAGAEAVPVDGLYDDIAAIGYAYGPAFRGLRAAWRLGDDIYAEAQLDGDQLRDAAAFGLHPALSDAALHALLLPRPDSAGGPAGPQLPFAFTGVRLHAAGAGTLRVRLSPAGPDGLAVSATDPAGNPVLNIDRLVVRPVEVAALGGTRDLAADALFGVDWTPLVTDWTAPDDDLVVVAPAEGVAPGPAGVREALGRALTSLQDWLADDTRDGARLVVVTRNAVAVAGEPVTDLAGAAVRGLVKAAQSEHPDRFVLLDTDQDTGRLPATTEPELAVRAGQAYAARLVRATGPATAKVNWRPDGTVLITGGGGVLGRLVARHLIEEHGVRHLLLTGRVAPEPGDLAGLGATIDVAACDAADRDALAALIATVPADRPLSAVVHSAGVLDDGVVEQLTPDRLDRVLRPKVDAAWHLHELTRDLDLDAFVLFSSASATLGRAGQGNYAAGNAYLDALAAYRKSLGLPAVSMAWGLWADRSALTGSLGDTRVAGSALSAAEGLALFDAALGRDEPLLVAAKLDLHRLRVRAGTVPPLLAALLGRGRRPAAGQAEGRGRLAGLSAAERLPVLGELVRADVADVLGYPGPEAVEPDRAFRDLGFDSLTAVELRNRLAARTGLRLPATLIFDHPTPVAVAGYLSDRLAPAAPSPQVGPDDTELRRLLAAVPLDRLRESGLMSSLLALNVTTPAAAEVPDTGDREAALKAMDADELVRLALGAERV